MEKTNNTENSYSISDDSGSEEEEEEEECPDCGEVFPQMNHLADHFMKHHQQPNKPIAVQSQRVTGGDIKSNYVPEKISTVKKLESPPPIISKPIVSENPTNNLKTEHASVKDPQNSLNSDEENIDTYENMLARYIQENDLPFIPRFRNRSDGNCWYEAIADQVVLHAVPNLPTDHAGLRKAVCDALLFLPQAKAWIKHLFGGKKNKFLAFIDKHRKDGQWTDAKGLMCQATALLVKRNIHIVGTANMDQKVCYTKLESVSEADKMEPMNVGYYQNKHYQSLEKINMEVDEVVKSDNGAVNSEVLDKGKEESGERKEDVNKVEPVIPKMEIKGKVARKPIVAKPLRKVSNSQSNNLEDKKMTEKSIKSTDNVKEDFKHKENNLMTVPVVNATGKSLQLQPPTKTSTSSDNMSKTSKQLKEHLESDKKIEEINKLLNKVTKSETIVPVSQKENSIGKIGNKIQNYTNEKGVKNEINVPKTPLPKGTVPQRKVPRAPIASQPLRKNNLENSINAKKALKDSEKNAGKPVPEHTENYNVSVKNQGILQKSTFSEAKTFVTPPKMVNQQNQNVARFNLNQNVQLNGLKNEDKKENVIPTKNVSKMKSFKISKREQPEEIKPQRDSSVPKIHQNKSKPQKANSIQMSLLNRRKLINDAALKIQKWFRHKYVGIIARKNFLAKKRAVVKIQRQCRSYLARKQESKIKAAITLQSKWRSFIFRRRFLRTKKAAESIQKVFRKNREGMVFRRAFLRKRKAALTIQSRWRMRMSELNGPCFQLLAPDEQYIDPGTGELQLINDYIINPETGILEKSQVNLEVYVNRLNRFLDFQALRKMALKSWKNTKIRTDLGIQFRNDFSDNTYTDVENNSIETETVGNCFDKDEKKIDLIMKPSKIFQNNNKSLGVSKWKKADMDETFFTGVQPEISHWKIPFNAVEKDKSDDQEYEALENLCTVEDEDLLLNLNSDSNLSFNSCIERESTSDHAEESLQSFFSSSSFTDLQKNSRETISWLERNLEAKQELLVKSATTIQACWRGLLERRRMESTKIVHSVLNKIIGNAIGPLEVAKDVVDILLDNVVNVKSRVSARASKSKIVSYCEDPEETDKNENSSSSMLLFSTFHSDPLSENEDKPIPTAKVSSNKKRKFENEEDLNVIEIDESDDIIEINASPGRKRKTRTFTQVESSFKRKKTRTNTEIVYLEESTDEEDDDLDELYENRPTKRRRSSPTQPQESSLNKDPKCFKCNKRFGSSNLKNHILSHYYENFNDVCPNEKPYACPECGKGSRDRITTMRHFAFSHHMIYEYTEVTPQMLKLR